MAAGNSTSRVFNLVWTGVFVLFAVLQYNDPDPWRWIPIYGLAAYLCYRYATGGRPQQAALLVIFFCIGYGVYLFMGTDGVFSWATAHNRENLVQSMKATKPWIENTREFGGLLIIIVVLSINYLRHRRTK
jgi:hypothetical protein